MDIFFFQLVIIFIPGIIWERLDAQYGQNKSTQQWDILRRTFVFGLSAYVVTFCVYWLANFVVPGLNFQVFQLKKDVEFIDGPSIKLIFYASVVSVVCAIVWLYGVNYKILTRLLQWCAQPNDTEMRTFGISPSTPVGRKSSTCISGILKRKSPMPDGWKHSLKPKSRGN